MALLRAGEKDQGRSELDAALKLDAGLRKRKDVQKVIGQLWKRGRRDPNAP